MTIDIASRQVNAMPAPTWHRLRMNRALLPEKLPDRALAAAIDVEGFVGQPRADAFDEALADLQARMGSPVRQDGKGEPAEGLDAPALSEYQRRLARREAAHDVAASFRTGSGAQAAALVEKLVPKRRVLATAPGAQDARAFMHLKPEGGAGACAVDIVLAEDSSADITLLFDAADADASFCGSCLRIFCAARSRLSLTAIQACGRNCTLLDNAGCVLDEDAHIEAACYSLSEGTSYTGLACDLRGARSSARMQVRYLAAGDAECDFNYEFDHHGRATESDLNANGVLMGESVKTLKATIDFIRGCKGAHGHEQETALIVGEKARNRSCPVILCGEDDVAGDHGATIGHINAEQLFYLACRGLAQADAEALFARSTVEAALEACRDDRARDAVASIARDADLGKEPLCIR